MTAQFPICSAKLSTAEPGNAKLGEHVGMPDVILCFLFFCCLNVSSGRFHFFGWLAALACGSGLFGQLILTVLALLVIIAGSIVCPVL